MQLMLIESMYDEAVSSNIEHNGIESEMYNQAGLNVQLNISSKEDKNSYDRAWFDKKISAMF